MTKVQSTISSLRTAKIIKDESSLSRTLMTTYGSSLTSSVVTLGGDGRSQEGHQPRARPECKISEEEKLERRGAKTCRALLDQGFLGNWKSDRQICSKHVHHLQDTITVLDIFISNVCRDMYLCPTGIPLSLS